MPWPGITDFSAAVQHPRLCFRGARLAAGETLVNQRGMPLVFSGAFACVYCVAVGGRKFAVRCFTREVRDQQRRYNQLSEYLISALPPSFVHFEYLEHGICLGGDWYPIVQMEWVEGEPLSNFVGARLDDPDALLRVAAQWRGGPVASLRGLRIAHNDLQHGNVMVQTDGRLRLVDYDGMFLPQFRGEPSPELGHKHYQHPRRSAEDYGASVDNFPALVIYLSLIALASDPGLWRFNNEDNLIFTRTDYADPRASDLFARLRKSPDRFVAALAERLEECCALPVEQVPDLETILHGMPPGAEPATPSRAPSARSSPAAPTAAPAPTTAPAPRAAPTAAPAPTATPAPTTAPTSRAAPAPTAPAAARRRAPVKLRRVIWGVVVTVIAVTAAVAAVMAWAVSVRGW